MCYIFFNYENHFQEFKMLNNHSFYETGSKDTYKFWNLQYYLAILVLYFLQPIMEDLLL